MKRSPLRKVSKTRAIELREYNRAKAEVFELPRICEFPDCYHPATQVHHMKGRHGSLINEQAYWMLLCMEHHAYIEDHKKEARERGWILYD